MSRNAVPMPLSERMVTPRDTVRFPKPGLVDPGEGKVTKAWAEWLTDLSASLTRSARRMFSVQVLDQNAALAATDMTNGTLAAGLYRVSYYATLAVVGSVSSSLTVTLDWVDRGSTKTVSGAAITANTLAVAQSGSFLIRADRNSPVRYSTAYASNAAGEMLYDLCLTLEMLE